jgi:hypothetical protein
MDDPERGYLRLFRLTLVSHRVVVRHGDIEGGAWTRLRRRQPGFLCTVVQGNIRRWSRVFISITRREAPLRRTLWPPKTAQTR